MKILGIDPGIAIIGAGVLDYDGNKFTALDYRAITTAANQPLHYRLKEVYDEVSAIVAKYRPDAMAVEQIFFNNNAKTAFAVGQGRGVILLAAVNADVSVFEYTPLQVKQAVTGYGRADKAQVQQMTKMLLNLNAIPKPDDVADALAIAICHAHSYRFTNSVKKKIGG